MRVIFLLLTFFFIIKITFGQDISKEYKLFIKEADSLYKTNDYINSAQKYSEAFKSNGWKGFANDKYNAACSWALAGVPDSAFSLLFLITNKTDYSKFGQINTDPDFASLYKDNRWPKLIELIKNNRDKSISTINKELVSELDTVFIEDQRYRKLISNREQKYGWKSNEMNELWKVIRTKDSINLIKITSILDNYGWLGSEIIGREGNDALFLVIQHSNQKTQEKYLPMIKEAVKNGKANASSLALLEDRIALGQGKMQIYGSQIGRNPETNIFYVLPLEDPDNVDKRRAEVGLPPLTTYLNKWQIKWDIEQYKKDLPKLIKIKNEHL